MKKRKTMKKIIALLLTVIIVICSLPMTTFANTLESTFLESENEAVNEGNENWHLIDEQEIVTDEIIGNVSEVESLREENVKHFRLADGTYEAIVYSQPVHRKDKEGVWQDIDNTIELKTYAKASKYATRDSRITFADRFTNNAELFTLSENGYSISMQLLSNGNEFDNEMETTDFGSLSTPIVNNRSEKRISTIFNSIDEAKKIDNKSSIVYNNIRKNINIEYVLNGNDVKENIIVNAPCESYEYIFQITLDGLFAELSNNGEILVKDNTTKDTEYIIPAPYMYDANGTYSYDVSYTLEQVKDEIYFLVVSADSEWINAEDRAFPVVIDPSINSYQSYYDTYTDTANPTANYGHNAELWVSNTKTTYIRLEIPSLPAEAVVNTAYLYVPYYYHISTGKLSAGAYRVLSDWGEYDLNYNNSPTLGSRISTTTLSASTSITQASPGNARFTMTNAVNEWHSGTPNYGVAIMRQESSTATNQSVILKSYEAYAEPTYITINYTYYLPSGVYGLQLSSNYTEWMSVENDYCWSGAKLQHEYSESSPASSSVFDRSRLFKITRVGTASRYTIRSMLNNNISFNIDNGKIVAKEIPSNDIDVPIRDTFAIDWQGDGFSISPYNSSYAISMSYSSGDLYPEITSNASTWELVQYVGTHKKGIELFANVTHFVVDKTATLKPAVWSTESGYNLPLLLVPSIYSSAFSIVWNNDTRTGEASFFEVQQIRIDWRIRNEAENDSRNGFIYTNIIPIEEGIYFIKNGAENKYIQIEKNAESHYSSGNTIEAWNLDGEEYQKWEFVYNGNGYYKIISTQSDLALSVQNNFVNAVAPLVQDYYNGTDSQLWGVNKSASGKYILTPKSNETYNSDWCISATAQSSENTDSFNVEQRIYIDDSNYRDEWILFRIGYASSVAVEGQQKSKWCWAASARMFAKHSYPSITRTQTDAVIYIKGDDDDEGGNRVEAQRAINYYISNITTTQINTVIKENVIYSEENLVRFLNDEHVIYISRGWYTDMNDSSSRDGGHATLIYGYTFVNSEIRFLIRDPLPMNEGKTEMISYNKLCCGANYETDEYEDSGVWYASIVVNTSYANDTIPYYFDQ